MDSFDNIDDEIDVETLSNGEGPSDKKIRRSYTFDKKIEVVEYAKKYGNHAAERRFSVCRGSIIMWRKKEKDLHSMNKKSIKSRLPGAGRHLLNVDLDEQIMRWINDQRDKKQRVTRRMIQNKAKQLYSQIDYLEEEKYNFVASNGWVQKFLLRHQLSCRMQTTVCQKPPEFYEKAIVDFIVYVRNKLVSGDISANCVYASDETAVWLDCSNSRCVAQKGSKDVSIMSSGHDKLRITVFLTGRMDGRKMKPYVLLPRKRPIPSIEKQFGNKLVLAWAGNEWMTDETTCDYLR